MDSHKKVLETEQGPMFELHSTVSKKLFPAKKNVRDEKLDLDPGNVLVDSIIDRGRVTDPVHIATLEPLGEFAKMSKKEQLKIIEKAQGVAGHRRVTIHAEAVEGLHTARRPDASKVDPFISVIMVHCDTQDEIEALKLDHGTQLGLTPYELAKAIEKVYNMVSRPTEKLGIWMLRQDLANGSAPSAVLDLKNKVIKEIDSKKWVNPLEREKAMQELYLKHWRGTYQRNYRIMCPANGNVFYKQNYHDLCHGLDAIKFTYEELAKLTIIKDKEEEKAAIQAVIDKNNKPSDRQRMWTQKQVEEKYNDCSDNSVVSTILGTVLNDQNAINAWPEMALLTEKLSELLAAPNSNIVAIINAEHAKLPAKPVKAVTG